MKVFGVGLQKTGTTTLGYCLMTLGFRHRSYDRHALWKLRKKDENGLKSLMDQYDSFEDEPWAHCYELADKLYPDAKFILTIRKNTEVWYKSLLNHCNRIPYNEHRAFLFGSLYPERNKEQFILKYEQHIERVKAYFKDRPEKLLIVNWEAGDSWKELCAFLDKSDPGVDFHRANYAPKKSYGNLNFRRVLTYMPIYYFKITYNEYIRPLLVKLGLKKDLSRLFQ